MTAQVTSATLSTRFVAREGHLAQLQVFLDRVLAGHGQVCFITGEAGAGKTALVREFARRAQAAHAGLLVAVGDCNAQTGIGGPYLPFRELLALLTGDVEARLAQGAITQENARRLRDFLRVSGQALVDLGPDLIDIFVPGVGLATRAGAFLAGKVGWLDRLSELTGRPAAGPGDLEQSHILEQYTQVLKALAAKQPLLLVLDDLQWADAASISLLFHLGRRLAESHILILGAYRLDETALGRGGEMAPTPSTNEASRHLAALWRDRLGIEIAWETRHWSDYLDLLYEKPPRMFLIGWTADYPDPDNFLRASPLLRYTRWQNKTYNELVEQARQATDQAQRMMMYQEADRILIQDAAIVPLTYERAHLLVRPWVRNYPMSAVRTWFWKDVIIEPH